MLCVNCNFMRMHIKESQDVLSIIHTKVTTFDPKGVDDIFKLFKGLLPHPLHSHVTSPPPIPIRIC